MTNITPHDLLPIEKPINSEPEGLLYFYDNVVEPLIPDTLRMMHNGIPIDLNKVSDLENTVVNVLDKVKNTLAKNPLMKEFIEEKRKFQKKEKTNTIIAKQKTAKDYLVSFKVDNAIHRTFLVNQYLKNNNQYNEYGKLDNSEWKIIELKKLNQILNSSFIERIIIKDTMLINEDITKEAMLCLAETKAKLFNSKKQEQIENIDEISLYTAFNPNSSPQLQEFFDYFDIESENKTPTGNPSWNRDSLDILLKSIKNMFIEGEE